MKKYLLLALILLNVLPAVAQDSFNYRVELQPVNITGLPGLHSYAFAQSNGKWLFIGGRKDGIHARQPFNAFPQSQNNTDIYVADVNTGQSWSAAVSSLPAALAEQLQATNMNFCQVEDTLYIMGGYAYSPTATDHITFPNLVTVQVSSLIQAVINNTAISGNFKQITDTAFAVTGGHLAHMGDTFYLVGGHKFTGRYNPMGNPTYTQAYTNQIRKFVINNSGVQPAINSYAAVTDAVHLHRRDYNLLPQIFPDGKEGFTISSGVFQTTADLPYLYPVDIKTSGHAAVTTFNQYLSNYHSANTGIYDSVANTMHNLFFGGMSQYFYQNGTMTKDDNVPFVTTISRVSRQANGTLKEYKLSTEMPALKGASAEFIINQQLATYDNDVVKMNKFNTDTILLGHIVGGIYSTNANAFTNNQTNTTSADNTVYAVRLVRDMNASVEAIPGNHGFDVTIYPNPAHGHVELKLSDTRFKAAEYFISTVDGRVIQQGAFGKAAMKGNTYELQLHNIAPQQVLVTVVLDNEYFITKQLLVK